tara:strand:+ start:66 stop:236 length:171 start_codon:yes stop_codon:yes gene_type:complete
MSDEAMLKYDSNTPRMPKRTTPKLFSSSSAMKYENKTEKNVEKNNLNKKTSSENIS